MSVRKLAADKQLIKWFDARMSHEEIIEANLALTGFLASRSSIDQAKARLGKTRRSLRHHQELPWKTEKPHKNDSIAQMLRLRSRRNQGEALSEKQLAKIASWERRLLDVGLVIIYEPNTEMGFHFVAREPSDGDSLIRVTPGAVLQPEASPEHVKAAAG